MKTLLYISYRIPIRLLHGNNAVGFVGGDAGRSFGVGILQYDIVYTLDTVL